jgi:S1-C subfamily serine protease
LDVTVKLAARPDRTTQTKEKAPYLGLAVVESDREVQVREVDQGSPAEKAGLKPGWRVVKFAQTDIKTVRDFLNAVKKSKPGENLALTVREPGGKESVLQLEVGTVAAEGRE